MRRARLAALLLALAVPAAAGTAAPAAPRRLTLDEAYALALQRSERLAVSAAGLREAEARMDELSAAVKPRLSFRASELFQDEGGGSSGGAVSSFNQRVRPEVRFSARQPLFSGFRELLALKSARSRTRASAAALRRAETLLYEDVALAYYELLGLRTEIEIRRDTVDISRRRIGELRRREELGRSRKSEALAARSQLAELEALVIEARGREAAAQESLRFLTGLEEDIAPQRPSAPAWEPLQGFLDRARVRPDVEALRHEAEAAAFTGSAVRRQRWPVIGVDGNYYLKRPSGFQEDIRWDALLSLDLPLYTGGLIAGQARQAEARRAAAEQELSLGRRRAELEVKTHHRTLGSALDSAAALEKAARLAKENAEAQAADYRLGLVTNLDVLEGLNSLQETRLRLEQARLEAALARARLDAAAGKIP